MHYSNANSGHGLITEPFNIQRDPILACYAIVESGILHAQSKVTESTSELTHYSKHISTGSLATSRIAVRTHAFSYAQRLTDPLT